MEKDCQAAPYPKPDEMADDRGHYEASTFGQCQPWFRNKAAKSGDKDITRVGKNRDRGKQHNKDLFKRLLWR